MDTVFPNNVRGYVLWYICDTLASVAEYVGGFLPYRPPSHLPSDIDHLSTECVKDLTANEPLRGDPSDFGSVARVTENTVYKWGNKMNRITTYSAEALALQIVAEQTTIPVPLVRRVTYDPEMHSNELAIEFVPGEQLGTVWPRLSWFGRLRVALTLRSYVRQLRHIRTDRSHIPGPLARPGEGGMIGSSPMYNSMVYRRGPFESYEDFVRIFNDGIPIVKEIWEKEGTDASQLYGKMDDSEPLVLTHHDLNPRNIMVGEDGRLWLIDFGWSGLYPPWVEFVSMRIQAERAKELVGWSEMIPLVCGWYRDQDEWFQRIQPVLWLRPQDLPTP